MATQEKILDEINNLKLEFEQVKLQSEANGKILARLDLTLTGNGRNGLIIDVDRLKIRSKQGWAFVTIISILILKDIIPKIFDFFTVV